MTGIIINNPGLSISTNGVALVKSDDPHLLPTPTPQGAVPYVNGTPAFALLSPGTAGQVLTSGGASANPSWTTISGLLSGMTTGRIEFAASSTTLGDDANLSWDNTAKRLNLGGGAHTSLYLVSGTIPTGENAISVTGTQASGTATEIGSLNNITSAGSGTSLKIGYQNAFLPGYTGNGSVVGFYNSCTVLGTGQNMFLGTVDSGQPRGNMAVWNIVQGNGSGWKYGSVSDVSGGELNVGVIAKANRGIGGELRNIGVIGVADNGSTSNTGGYFALRQPDNPTFATAALIADNGTAASPIFLGRDNGSVVFTIADGGGVTATSTLSASSLTATGLTANRITYAGTGGLLQDSANLTYDGTTLAVTGGTLGTGVKAITVTATHATASSAETAISETITSAGTGVVTKTARALTYAAGYTSAGTTLAESVTNSVAGTGASLKLTTSATAPLGNVGYYSLCNGSTATGYSIASYNEAQNGAINTGVVGKANASTNASVNYGVIGTARNATTNVGGFFTLGSSDNPTAPPHCALVCDNGTSAQSLFIARSSSTNRFSILTGGAVSANVSTGGSTGVTNAYSFAPVIDDTSITQVGFQTTSTPPTTSNQVKTALTAQMGSGYTGSGTITALRGLNSTTAGTGLVLGDVGEATTLNSAGSAIGSTGWAQNVGAGKQIGVLALVGTTGATTSYPSAALVCDNESTSSPVFIGQVAGTTKISIDSSGNFLADTQLPQTTNGVIAHKSDGGISVGNSGTTIGHLLRTLRVTTTNSASATNMTLDDAGSSVGLSLASGTVHGYTIYITARATAGTNANSGAMYRIDVAAKNIGGTTSLVGTATATTIGVDAGAATWAVTAVSNNGASRLDVQVTGDAATTINWTARVEETAV